MLAACLLALVLFFQGFFRLRRRGRTDHAGWDRAALFVAAVALVYAALASPIAVAGEDQLLSAHMLEHLLFGDLAIALAMLAVRGPLVFFFLPPPILTPLAHSPRLRRFLRWLTGPWVALAIWTASMWVWHIPRFYDYAAAHPVVHELEHLSFFVGGVLDLEPPDRPREDEARERARADRARVRGLHARRLRDGRDPERRVHVPALRRPGRPAARAEPRRRPAGARRS